MPVQTTYSQDRTIAVDGMLGDTSLSKDAVSKHATEEIKPGVFVVFDAAGGNDDDVKLPDATGLVTGPEQMGVSLLDVDREAANYAAGETLAALRKGRIWVITEDAATPADSVHVRFVAGGGGSQLGAFRTDADTASAVDMSAKLKFRSTAGAGELVLLEVDL